MSTVTAPQPSALESMWERVRGLCGLSSRRAEQGTIVAQLTPITLFFGLFFLAPIAVFFVYSLWTVNGFEIVQHWSLDTYKKVLTEPITRQLIWATIKIGFIVSICSVCIAYVFAHIIRFHLRRWQGPLLFLVLMALFSGYLVRIYAWTTILGNSGIINSALLKTGIIDHPLTFLLYSRTAITVVLTNFLVPLTVLPIYAALENVGDAEIEAARDLGCGARQALRRVTLPLAWPGVFAGWALAFIIATGDYITPQLVGGVSGTMIGQNIALEFNQSFDWPAGAAIAFVSLAAVLLIVSLVGWVGKIVLR